MIVNKLKLLSSSEDREITLPLGQNWDLLNRSDTIDSYERTILQEVIGLPVNYELDRFSRTPINDSTQQTYTFYFKKPNVDVWENSYTYSERFTLNEVRKNVNSFKNSFYKLDLYDSDDPKTQKIYLSIILRPNNGFVVERDCVEYIFSSKKSGTLIYSDCCNTQQSINVVADEGVSVCSLAGTQAIFTTTTSSTLVNFEVNLPNVYSSTAVRECDCTDENSTFEPDNSTVPTFYLDHIGNQESYYIYWFQDKNLLNIDSLYMTVKFFDAKDGTYTNFTTIQQNSFADRYNVPNDYFYYKVNFDYGNKFYEIINIINNDITTNVKWYEYENPPLV